MNYRPKIDFQHWQDVHWCILARPRQAERGQRGRRQQQRRINRIFGWQWSGSSTIQSGFSTVDKLSRRRFPIFIWQFDNKKKQWWEEMRRARSWLRLSRVTSSECLFCSSFLFTYLPSENFRNKGFSPFWNISGFYFCARFLNCHLTEK